MRIDTLKRNLAVLRAGQTEILFSYGKAVAGKNLDTGQFFRTSTFWSDVTTRHIKDWLGSKYVESYAVDQDTLEKIAEDERDKT